MKAFASELCDVAHFWDFAEKALKDVEEFRQLRWADVDGVQIEIATKATHKTVVKELKARVFCFERNSNVFVSPAKGAVAAATGFFFLPVGLSVGETLR